jgi:hypothetical protein
MQGLPWHAHVTILLLEIERVSMAEATTARAEAGGTSQLLPESNPTRPDIRPDRRPTSPPEWCKKTADTEQSVSADRHFLVGLAK